MYILTTSDGHYGIASSGHVKITSAEQEVLKLRRLLRSIYYVGEMEYWILRIMCADDGVVIHERFVFDGKKAEKNITTELVVG